MIFGFTIVLSIVGLAVMIALGKVEENTSHGLMPLVTALAAIGGNFSAWAFGTKGSNKSDE